MSRDSYIRIKTEHVCAYFQIFRYNNITVEAKSQIILIYIISFGLKSSNHDLFFYTTRSTNMLLSELQNKHEHNNGAYE